MTLQGTFDSKPDMNGSAEAAVGGGGARKRAVSMLEITDDDYVQMLIKHKYRKMEHGVSSSSGNMSCENFIGFVIM